MGRIDGLRSRLSALLRRRGFERDLNDELRFHLEMETAAGLERGLGPDEARRRARMRLGGEEGVREAVREARGLRMLDDLRLDVRYAFRSLRRNPGFALVAVITLGLGIGATTAVYSVVDGVLLRPLPWAEADRLVVVWQNDRISGTQREPASLPDYADIRERARSFSGVAAWGTSSANMAAEGSEPERIRLARVTSNVFEVVGAQAVAGRFFEEAEGLPGGARVAVVSESLLRAMEGGVAGVVGGTVRIDDVAYQVVGVAPATFAFPEPATAVWVPWQVDPAAGQRARHDAMLVARLAPSVRLEAAQTEMDAIAADLEAEYATNRGRGAFVEPVRDALLGDVRPSLLIALGAVALVLLVACSNVASLLLARGAARSREIAVRTALGARGERLARQFTVESLVLALAGGALGIAVARLGVRPLLALAPADLPRAADIAVDGRVLLAALALSIGAGLIFGLVPVRLARATDLNRTLREEGRGTSGGLRQRRVRAGIVVAEIALSMMLLVGAGLLVRSLAALQRVDPGFDPGNLLKVEYTLPDARYPQSFDDFPNWTEIQRFQSEVRARIDALQGVESVALATQHPLDIGFTNSFVIEGRENEYEAQPEIRTRMVGTGYLETVGVPLLSGRDIDQRDGPASAMVALINEAGARRFFPDTDPVGQRISFWGITRDIVGVVGDERFAGPGQPAPPALYVPLAQAPIPSGSILVRTSVDPSTLVSAIRGEIRTVDPALAVFGVSSMDGELRAAVGRERFAATLLTLFAATALILAVVGVHGLLSYAVAQRTRELGIRMALGATRRSVLSLVVREGMRLVAAGLIVGFAGALVATRFLRSLLFGVGPADPLSFALAATAVLGAALVASLVPARRATSSDPMRALRVD